jgi:hypothetical protein
LGIAWRASTSRLSDWAFLEGGPDGLGSPDKHSDKHVDGCVRPIEVCGALIGSRVQQRSAAVVESDAVPDCIGDVNISSGVIDCQTIGEEARIWYQRWWTVLSNHRERLVLVCAVKIPTASSESAKQVSVVTSRRGVLWSGRKWLIS